MKRGGEQQFGITNFLSDRMKLHARFNWVVIDTTGSHDGGEVYETERKFKRWLKEDIGLVGLKT